VAAFASFSAREASAAWISQGVDAPATGDQPVGGHHLGLELHHLDTLHRVGHHLDGHAAAEPHHEHRPRLGAGPPVGACCFTDGTCIVTSVFDCSVLGGQYLGDGVPCTQCPDPCPGDVNGDGVVDFSDIIAILNSWGFCPGCPADLDGDNFVGFSDLILVLINWGNPC